MEKNKKITSITYIKSFWSLLSALPFSTDDTGYHSIMDERPKYESFDSFNFFQKNINDTVVPWFETPHGAYTITKRNIPIKEGNKYKSHEAYAVVFSPDPLKLKALLSGDTSASDNISVLAIHTADDLMVNGSLSIAPLLKIMKRHNHTHRDRVQSHTTFIIEGDLLIRSDSCIVFAIEDKRKKGYFNLYQYFNPSGKDGLFLTDEIFENKKYQRLLKLLSLKTNKDPIPYDKLGERMITLSNDIANNIMKHTTPDKQYKGITNTFKKISKNIIQSTTFLISRIHIPTVIIGALSAAFFSAVSVVAATIISGIKVIGFQSLLTKAGIASILLSNNPLSKAINGASNFLGKILRQNKLNKTTRLYDYKNNFSSDNKPAFDDANSCRVSPNFFKNISFAPIEIITPHLGIISINNPRVRHHTEISEQQWELQKRCHADCYDDASFIQLVKNPRNGDIVLLLVDGKGQQHIHISKNKSIHYDDGHTTLVYKDDARDEFFARQAKNIPDYLPVNHNQTSESLESQPRSKSNKEELDILPPKKTYATIGKLTALFPFRKAGESSAIKSPHPSVTVAPDANGPKL